MAKGDEKREAMEATPIRLSRIFPAPRETVFEAWSSADHIKQWFAPEGFTLFHAKVEPRNGGAFEWAMRGPDGVEHWVRGRFVDVSRPDRLVFESRIEDNEGHALFDARTEVNFVAVAAGTRLELMQTYTILDPDAVWMTKGAPEGWASTLNKLEKELSRMGGR